MKSLLVIKDLLLDDSAESRGITLSSTKMRGIVGGRSVLTQVDRNGLSTFDDFQMNIAIWEGRVKGPMIN